MLCRNCNEEIKNKRKDAVYCSTYCGNNYRNRKYYSSNYHTLKQKRWHDNLDTPRRIWYRVKSRAKKYCIDFDIEVADIIVPEKCPVLGIDLVHANQGRGYHPDSASLDRIYPDKGYVKGNVRVVSARANLLKNDATIQELEAVIKDLKELWGDD